MQDRKKEVKKQSFLQRLLNSNPNRQKVNKGSDPKKKKIINLKRD